jgi:hypothetical protein
MAAQAAITAKIKVDALAIFFPPKLPVIYWYVPPQPSVSLSRWQYIRFGSTVWSPGS